MAEHLPIIYVRGYGGGQSGIDRVVDDPFYGFNEGSTHIRVGAGGEPRFHQFEGPMLRLMTEDGYKLRVGGSQADNLLATEDDSIEDPCLWVYRFYDPAAGTFGKEPEPYEIEKAATGLVDFVRLVRSKTKGSPKVHLVAHSMGGLIVRSALQRVLAGQQPEDVVEKVVTIGSPHGSIDPKVGGGVGDWFMRTFGPNGSDIFEEERMKTYLLPDGYPWQDDPKRGGAWDSRHMVGTFPVDRILCVVGTNARDYEVAHGASAMAMGEQSDGLVAISNAYVRGAPRAYVHRSHSGRYGLVNSEETYQNLKRFLFGVLRVEIELTGLDEDRLGDRVWQATTHLAIREVPVTMHEQSAEHFCPVDLNQQAKNKARDAGTPFLPVPLIAVFLVPGATDTFRYALTLGVTSLAEKHGWFDFKGHLEKTADWTDALVVDVTVEREGDKIGNVTAANGQWNSQLPGRLDQVSTDELSLRLANPRRDDGTWAGTIPLPESARTMLGDEASLSFVASLWS